ncbi:MAG: prolipoprotein diacylglyceryl transferase [Armatimonadota bacterium]|nr:prolipoprotein diacylglyceryl transferase [Armatimonadota bacterium]MDR5697053.1 prolipoprotein diacylglyceryl transferase [Armatimonadota bacterium]
MIVEIGPLAIRWYGLMMALSILTGIWLSQRMGPRLGVPSDLVDRIAVPLIVWLFVGARLGYVLSHPGPYVADPLEILRVDRGGLSSHGAIAAGLLYLWRVGRQSGMSPWTLADMCATWIPAANVFVRFGNLMNGELYGDPTSLPWGLLFPGVPGGPRHPLQLYEMVTSAVLFFVVQHWVGVRRFSGQIFWQTIVWMSVVRFLLDLLRSEERTVGFLALGQIAALALIAVGAWFLWRGRHQL